jgi:rod shape-determining protein MreD
LQTVTPLARVPGPDIVLLVVVYAALAGRGDLGSVAGMSMFLGYLADLFAGSPKGVHLVAYTLLGLVARMASSRLLVRGGLFTALVCGLFALGFGFLPLFLRRWLWPGLGISGRALLPVPLTALATAVCAPLVFRVLRRLDRSFLRDPRALASSA